MFLLDALRGKVDRPIPIWMMRQAGRHLPEYRRLRKETGDFLDLCYTPELACQVALQPVDRYDFDAAILFSDILVIPDALGQKVEFLEGKGPCLDPLTGWEDVARLNPSALLSRLSPVLDAVSLTRERLPREKALIGFCGAPWTLALYMIQGRVKAGEAQCRPLLDSDLLFRLIDLLVESCVSFLCAQVDAGADLLQIFDSWAKFLEKDEWKILCKEPILRIARAVKEKRPDTPILVFPRGSGSLCEAFAEEGVVDGLSADNSLDLQFLRERIQQNITVQGNLDPVVLADGGEVLEKTVDTIVNALGNGPFIFNLGHGILPRTPVKHIERTVAQVRKWSAEHRKEKNAEEGGRKPV